MNRTIKGLGLAIGLLLTASAVSAAPCATTGSITLTTAQVSVAGTCNVGSITFNNFQIAGVVFPGGGSSVTPFELNVTSIANGLLFQYSNFVGLDFRLTYNVSPGVGAMILGTNSAVAVSETICTVAFNPGALETCAGKGGTASFAQVGAGGQAQTTPYLAGNTGIFVFKDVNGGSDFTQIVVPEPFSISLVGFGLLGLGLIGRRRR